MPRRTKGEGTVFWSRSEKYWIAEITSPDGSRKRKRSKERQIVSDWLFEQRKTISEYRQLPDDKISFNQFADRFLEDIAQHTMKEKTFVSYEGYLRLHIRPEIGHLRLSAITPQHIQHLYSRKLKDGLSKKTVHHIHTYLRRVLNQAVKWELIYRNPCDSVTPPRVDKKPPNVWKVEEAQTFLNAVRGHRFYGIYLIALTTGARRGEILGLEWQNINWPKGTITIDKTVNEIKGRAVITDPKTKASRRTIALPSVVLDLLRQDPAEKGLIFPSTTGGPLSPRNLLRHYYSVLDTLSIPHIRFHDLRHTAATILLQKDVHPKKVQELLGHSSITLTLDTYSHIIPGIDDQTAKEMDAIFSI